MVLPVDITSPNTLSQIRLALPAATPPDCDYDAHWTCDNEGPTMNYPELIAGTVLGWLVALAQNHFSASRQKMLQLDELKKIMKFNLDRMIQMQGEITNGVLPDYRLDLAVADFLLSLGEKLFNTTCEFNAYNWRRNQMHHINCEMDMLFSLEGDTRFAGYRTKVLNHLQGEIHGTRKVLNGGCNCG